MLPRSVNAQGQILTKAGPPAAGAVFNGGIACAPTGEIYTTTTVPASPGYCNGFLVSPAGELVVASAGTPVSFPEGIGRLANGSVLISTNAPVAADEFCGGARVTDAGALLVSSGGGAATDPNFANVVALLHGNGPNASTVFTDQKGHAFTAAGNAQISTTDTKFGTASMLFDGSGDWISSPDNVDWEFGSGNFTIEFWFKAASLTRWGLVSHGPESDWATFDISTDGSNVRGLELKCSNGGGWQVDIATPAAVWTLNTWTFVQAVRNGNVFTLNVDGVQKATVTVAVTLRDSAASLFVGRSAFYSSSFNGRIYDLRITKGVARANVVPTAQFPDA